MADNNWVPNRKVAVGAAGIGVPAGIVIAWALKEFFGIVMEQEVAAAMGSLISTFAAYWIPNEG